MRLQKASQILSIWKYSLDQGANVVLMRHAPRETSEMPNECELSEVGKQLAIEYGAILGPLFEGKEFNRYCTSKNRTRHTLSLLFPRLSPDECLIVPDLDGLQVSEEFQKHVNDVHRRFGRWRGHYVTHTLYFLEELGGSSKYSIRTDVARRTARGIKALLQKQVLNIYCGHSPQLEAGCQELFGLAPHQLGGFLNPLDSIHLKLAGGEPRFVARVSPIVDYRDIESEMYFRR